jgi:hypothetical protein
MLLNEFKLKKFSFKGNGNLKKKLILITQQTNKQKTVLFSN